MKKPKNQKRLVEQWNKRHPKGTRVLYHPVIDDPETDGQVYETAGQAFLLSGHIAVVWLNGKSGCVAVEAVEPFTGGAR